MAAVPLLLCARPGRRGPWVPRHAAPRGPRPPLRAASCVEPPAPRAPSGPARTCPKPDSPPAPPRNAHLPAAPRMGNGSFSGRMGSAGGSGPAPRAGRGPSSNSPRSSSGAGGAGRLGMTRTGQLGRRVEEFNLHRNADLGAGRGGRHRVRQREGSKKHSRTERVKESRIPPGLCRNCSLIKWQ